MADPLPWQAAFVAMTFALGDTVADATLALGPENLGLTRNLALGLADKDRQVRARTLAGVMAQLTADLEETRLA